MGKKEPLVRGEWTNIALVNYEIDPVVLEPYLPQGIEQDSFDNKYYVSIVGLYFRNTRLKGIRFPFNRDFEEINFRFYVKRKVGDETRRGVVFIREFVSKPLIAFGAALLFGENYKVRATDYHYLSRPENIEVEYKVKQGKWNGFSVLAEATPYGLPESGIEKFFCDRPWGYTRRNKTTTLEYHVAHPKWDVYNVKRYNMDIDFSKLYSTEFEALKFTTPAHLYYLKGSPIEINISGIIS